MVPAECRNWDYESHPNAATIVADRCRQLLLDLGYKRLEPRAPLHDSRPVHRRLFKGLTPTPCPYLAGHYRGEEFDSLIDYEVGIRGDAAVGAPAANVWAAMQLFVVRVDAILNSLRAGSEVPHSVVPEDEKLLFVVIYAAEIHEEFPRIHPFANGNGHVGRFLVWCLLGIFGFWPKTWPLDDRPQPESEYGQCLMAYRAGHKEPLVQFMLKHIVGE